MKINRDLLKEAVEEGILSEQQSGRLWDFLHEHNEDTPSFCFTHVLYYFGGLIAIGAMSLFMTLGWEIFGGWGLFGIALTYAGVGLWLTGSLLKRNYIIPAGVAATFVVALTPLAIYGLQTALGWWASRMTYREYYTHIDWRWVFMELGTLLSGAILLWRYRLPFLVMPIAVTLWYMSMDVTPFLLGENKSWDIQKVVSLWFGLLLAVFAFAIGLRTKQGKDFAFWLYMFGVIAFWVGLSLMGSDSELSKFMYLSINLVMIVIGAVLSRKVFAVFGGIGAVWYLGHLAYDVFQNSIIFPFVMTILGFGIIYAGIVWQRNEKMVSNKLRSMLPLQLRKLIKDSV